PAGRRDLPDRACHSGPLPAQPDTISAPAALPWAGVPVGLRRLLFPVIVGGLILAASLQSRLAGTITAAVALGLAALLLIVLPRLAHAAFTRGDWRRAELYYRCTRFFISNAESRGAIDVSLAGCRLARADWSGALVELADVEPGDLGVAARAAWYN